MFPLKFLAQLLPQLHANQLSREHGKQLHCFLNHHHHTAIHRVICLILPNYCSTSSSFQKLTILRFSTIRELKQKIGWTEFQFHSPFLSSFPRRCLYTPSTIQLQKDPRSFITMQCNAFNQLKTSLPPRLLLLDLYNKFLGILACSPSEIYFPHQSHHFMFHRILYYTPSTSESLPNSTL